MAAARPSPHDTHASPETPAGRWAYPVREYIGDMAAELARMAQVEGDDALGDLLQAAARQAARAP